MCTKIKAFAVLAWMFFSIQPAHAILIDSSATLVSGNTWEVTYEFTNDSVVDGIEFVSIFYEFGLFENLQAISGPSGWVVEVFDQVGAFGNNDGIVDFFLDDFFSASPISLGQTLGEFVLRFDFLGDPAEAFGVEAEVLQFDPIDPFAAPIVVESGTSNVEPLVSNAVPAPGAIALLLVSIGCLYRIRKIKR